MSDLNLTDQPEWIQTLEFEVSTDAAGGQANKNSTAENVVLGLYPKRMQARLPP